VSRRLKIALAVAGILVAALAVNAVVLSNQTRGAERNVEGAELVQTSEGAIQMLDEGDPGGSPIVLIHCWACSMRWWDRLVPLLAENHRVIRVDLLGHGGSDKPGDGYSIADQAAAVEEALSELGVSGAVLVGHSLGGAVAAELAGRDPGLARSVVTIGTKPTEELGELSLLARLGLEPVVGPALKQAVGLAPASLLRDQYGQAFAPGFDLADGFEDPDQVVEDARAMTYPAYVETHDSLDDYLGESSLAERISEAKVPLTAVFGAEDQIVADEDAAAKIYAGVPGAETVILEGIGHSANVESPQRTAQLIRALADRPPTKSN
jgi:pimeloyl-ACP methyl ester carboxylesterase